MKRTFTVLFGALMAISVTAQDVTLKITYKGAPLCDWEVSLKHGDGVIAKTTSDKNGVATFSNPRIISKSVDAAGYKAHSSGEKKWDVKGYITLNDDNYYHLEFEKMVNDMVKDSGMPKSMIEASWGLTLGGCGGSSTNTASQSDKSKNEDTSFSEDDDDDEGGGFGNSGQKSGDMKSKLMGQGMSQVKQQTGVDPLETKKKAYTGEIQALKIQIPKKEKELQTAGNAGEDTSLLALELAEMNAKLEHRNVALQITELEMAGKRPSAELANSEKELKAEYDKLRAERKKLEDEIKMAQRTEHVEAGESSGGSGALGALKLQKMKTDLMLKKRSLEKDEKSGKYNEEYLSKKRKEIELLEREIALMEKK
jgi:hypothetical protein